MFNPFKKKSKPIKGPASNVRQIEQEKPAPETAQPERSRGERRIIGVLERPHLTEKSNAASSRGWYTFRVASEANKIMIRQAVEDRYGVAVQAVRILRARPKNIRIGRIEGRTPGFKKAMVKVKEGQAIEFT